MTPIFKVTANDTDITHAIKDRLLSLEVTDETGNTADSLTINLDNRDHTIEEPILKTDGNKHATELKVWLGYAETGITNMGTFYTDEVSHSYPPAVLTISAKSADVSNTFKSQRSTVWSNKTLQDILQTIADRSGYNAKIHPNLANITIWFILQNGQSDMDFLRALAEKMGFLYTQKGNSLIITPLQKKETADAQKLEPVTLQETDLETYTISVTTREPYQTIHATYYDVDKAQEETVVLGSEEEPIKNLQRTYPSKDEAEQAAQAALEQQSNIGYSFEGTIAGNPNIFAELPLTIPTKATQHTSWIAQTVNHSYTDSGYKTSISAIADK